MPAELPVLIVPNAVSWTQWLAREAGSSKGVWLVLAKKGFTNPTSLTYTQALDEALCYGWIDGQTRKRDESTYSHRFTPRTTKSGWSQRNVGFIARLESEGRVQPRGRLEVDRAKADGRWDVAYAGQATMEAPSDLLAAIAMVPSAQALWDILTKQNRFALCYRLGSIKTEAARVKRIEAFVDMLAQGKTPHPQKQTLEFPKVFKPGTRRQKVSSLPSNKGKVTRRSARIKKPANPP